MSMSKQETLLETLSHFRDHPPKTYSALSIVIMDALLYLVENTPDLGEDGSEAREAFKEIVTEALEAFQDQYSGHQEGPTDCRCDECVEADISSTRERPGSSKIDLKHADVRNREDEGDGRARFRSL